MSRSPEPIIRASEVAQYAFCHRAWWLSRVKGHRPANAPDLARGSRAHSRHGRSVRVWLGMRRAAMALLLLGLLTLILALHLMSRGP